MKLRDIRNPGWFWAQNELFDVFLPLIGVNGVAVYMAMCRMLPNSQNGRISLRELEAASGVSKSEVQRVRRQLVALGMIAEKVTGPNSPSTFELLDLRAAAEVGPEELKRRQSLLERPEHAQTSSANTAPQPTVPGMKAGTVAKCPTMGQFGKKSQYLRGSPQNETVPPRDSLGVPGTEVSQAVGQFALGFNSLNKDSTERESTRAGEAAVLDLEALATKIVVEHPRAQLCNWTPRDVQAKDRDAVVEAARAEAELLGGTPEDHAVLILDKVRRLGREVPRSHWRFLKPVAAFMSERQYRAEPSDLYRGEFPTKRSEASVGMQAPRAAEPDRAAALAYWRTVKGSPIYEHQAPRWAKEMLDAAPPTQQNPAA